jgi:hypothetical protein
MQIDASGLFGRPPHPISCLRHEMSLSPKGRGGEGSLPAAIDKPCPALGRFSFITAADTKGGTKQAFYASD